MRVARIAALGLVLTLVWYAAVAEGHDEATLRWQGCPAGAHGGYSAATMRCGWFEPGARLAGQPVRLRVTRLQVHPDGPTPHPIIYLPGGPGDPGGQAAAALRAWRRFQQQAGWPRDLVIVDPRGTGLSTPRPSCPSPAGDGARDALANCFDKLGPATAEALGASAQVRDLHRLIQALGQGSAVIWAESYGGLIGQRLAARYPDDVRLLILDSPVLRPQPAPRRQAAAFHRRRRQLIAGCNRHLACRLAVPSLAATIDGLIAARQARPRPLSVAEPPYRARRLTVDGDALRAMLLLSAYGAPEGNFVRHALRRALRQPSALATLAGPLLALDSRQGRTAPVYWSTRCQFARPYDAARQGRVRMPCRDWPVARLAPIADRPPIPALVITGERDVLTPADTAARVALSRPGWQFLPVRDGGHGVLAASRCAQSQVQRFITRRGAWLDTLRCDDGAQRTPSERRANDVTHAHR